MKDETPIVSRLWSVLTALVLAVLAVLALALMLASDCSDNLIELLCANHRRFYACLMLSCAAGAFALWLIPSRSLGNGLCAAVLVVGMAAGALWERRAE